MKFDLIIFSDRIEEEAKIAIDYYTQINIEPGSRFFDELIATYNKIGTTQQHYSYITSSARSRLRDLKLPSFPMLIFSRYWRVQYIW
jgi:hypothetical protein